MENHRPLSSPGIVFGSIGLAVLLFTAGVWKEASTPHFDPPVTYDWSTAPAPSPDAGSGPGGDVLRERLVDRYGNEVHRAIGDYRIDYRGDVYERHSPNTALPKLAPPAA